MPKTGEIVRSALKPIGEVYTSKAIDTNKDQIITASIEPATEEEVQNTVTVMGGEDWELWMGALSEAGVLADGVKTVAYFLHRYRPDLANLLARRAGQSERRSRSRRGRTA